MHISFWKVFPAAVLLLAVPGFALTHPKTVSSKRHEHASLRRASVRHGEERHASERTVSEKHRRGWHLRQRHHYDLVEMPPERATQIQTALIKRGYLTGEPTGTWDASTIAAMQKLQADNGWQTKLTPDSRALIKLGLGPKDNGPGAAPSAGALPAAAAANAPNPSHDDTQTPQ